MIKVRKFRAASFVVGHMDLFWEVEDTVEDTLDYTFTVERSESPGGPWDTVTRPFTDKYFFRDTSLPGVNIWRQLFYRLLITHKDGGTSYSEIASQEAQPDLQASEIRRTLSIILSEGNGRTAWLYPARTFGTRCPACFDSVLGKRISSNCITCYNRGYARGFLSPIAILLQVNPTEKADQLGPIVTTQQQNVEALTSYYPPLRPYDVIVEAENKRWRVVRVSAPEHLRAMLWQNPILHAIQQTDVEYRLPIDLDDLSKLQPSPERSFLNPQTADNVGLNTAALLNAHKVY